MNRSARTPGPVLFSTVAGTFSGLSRLRGRRIVHPHGVGFEARLYPRGEGATGSRLFDGAEPVPAVVRLSRSLGLPEALADPCGLALRVPHAYGDDQHQDFLLVTSARRPVARHLLLPARGFSARTYSCLLPYRIGESLMLVGAEPVDRPPGPSLAELRERERAGLSFAITLATPSGTWREVARLELGARLAPEAVEALRFNPAHAGGGIEPVGLLNDLRPAAYRGSQEGRRRSGPVAGGFDPGRRREPDFEEAI